MKIERIIIILLIILLLISLSHNEKKIYIYHDFNISKPIIVDFGGCTKNGCILLLYNNGTKTVKCKNIKLYRDGKFYSTLDKLSDIYGQPCDYIQPNRFIRLKTPNLCQDVEKITIKSNFTDSLINDDRLYSFYISNYLCIEHQYNKTKLS